MSSTRENASGNLRSPAFDSAARARAEIIRPSVPPSPARSAKHRGEFVLAGAARLVESRRLFLSPLLVLLSRTGKVRPTGPFFAWGLPGAAMCSVPTDRPATKAGMVVVLAAAERLLLAPRWRFVRPRLFAQANGYPPQYSDVANPGEIRLRGECTWVRDNMRTRLGMVVVERLAGQFSRNVAVFPRSALAARGPRARSRPRRVRRLTRSVKGPRRAARRLSRACLESGPRFLPVHVRPRRGGCARSKCEIAWIRALRRGTITRRTP